MLDETTQSLLARRLERIEGRLRRIHVLLHNRTPCPELLRDLAQAQEALLQVSAAIMTFHVQQCVVPQAAGGDRLSELVEIFDRFL